MEREFLQALVVSPTFYRSLAENGLPAVVLLMGSAVLLKRRFRMHRLAGLRRDCRGSASAVDFTMTFPFFMFMMLLIVQSAMVVNTSLIVHYAAYAAARSAKVWAWDTSLVAARLERLAEQQIGTKRGRANARFALNGQRARANARKAARYALIAASPVSPRAPSSPGTMPTAALAGIARGSGMSGREGALIQQARYAFDPANSTVDISRPPITQQLDWFQNADANSWPLQAKVEYRMRLGVPIVNALLGNAGSGGYYRWLEAEIVLL